MSEIYWKPCGDYVNNSNLKAIFSKYRLKDYNQFLKLSIEDPEWFWSTFLEEINFWWSKKYEKVLDLSRGKQFPNWFIGGQTNWVYNALHKWANKTPYKVAIIYSDEKGVCGEVTYSQLQELTERIMYGLSKEGFKVGEIEQEYI
jgi:acetyl-CoA synthetase